MLRRADRCHLRLFSHLSRIRLAKLPNGFSPFILSAEDVERYPHDEEMEEKSDEERLANSAHFNVRPMCMS